MLTATDTIVREAREADAARLDELVQHFLAATPYHAAVEVSPEQRGIVLARFLSGGFSGRILVAEREGVVVGLLGLLLFPNLLTGQITASDVLWWVEPTARGCGRLMLEHGEAWARLHGAQVMHIVAWDNPRLEAFYARLGYVKLETVYSKPL